MTCKRIALYPLEKVLLLVSNALNANEIFGFRTQSRCGQQGSIGKKYYALLLNFISTKNIFELSPAPKVPAEKRSYSSVRPHLNKLLPVLTETTKKAPLIQKILNFRVSNQSFRSVQILESALSIHTPSTPLKMGPGANANLTYAQSSSIQVNDLATGKSLGNYVPKDWSVNSNFVSATITSDGRVEFLHDLADDYEQTTSQKLKNSELKDLMKYLYTDEQIKKNLANLKESLNNDEFWCFPTREQARTVHHELKKILGFKYVRLWEELLSENSPEVSTNDRIIMEPMGPCKLTSDKVMMINEFEDMTINELESNNEDSVDSTLCSNNSSLHSDKSVQCSHKITEENQIKIVGFLSDCDDSWSVMATESDLDDSLSIDLDNIPTNAFASEKEKKRETRKTKSSNTTPKNLSERVIIKPAFLKINEPTFLSDEDRIETKVNHSSSENINLQGPTSDIVQFYQEMGAGMISEVESYGPYYSEACSLPQSTAMLCDPLDIDYGV